ncbi:MAG: hypothetical protein IH958_00275 [Chloroflexi bacterium]|nr:hypothetical protein [Chloroflexota bacterium]
MAELVLHLVRRFGGEDDRLVRRRPVEVVVVALAVGRARAADDARPRRHSEARRRATALGRRRVGRAHERQDV